MMILPGILEQQSARKVKVIDALQRFFDYDFSDTSTLTLDTGNEISAVQDLTTNNRDISQTGTARAIYNDSIQNGKGTARFSGGQFYDVVAWNGNDFTIYCVVIPRDPSLADKPQEQHIVQWGDTGGGVARMLNSIRDTDNDDTDVMASQYAMDPSSSEVVNTQGSAAEVLNIGSAYILTFAYIGDAVYSGYNKNSLVSDSNAFVSPGQIDGKTGAIGRADDDSSYLSADIGRIIVCDRDELSNRDLVVDELATEWGISI